jgi:uncharacterized protein (UPF0332 family)
MFDAAHAALWAAGARPPGAVIKSHSGLVSVFGEEVVKTGKIAPEWGRALSNALKTRLLADYEGDQPSVAVATRLVGLADEFIGAVKATFSI